MSIQFKSFSSYCLVISLFILCVWSYYPGLDGGFLLDDFANLDKLGKFNGVRNFDTFIKFVGNGIAGPTGRPLSLLSFLLNGTNWPTAPFPFKLTNVILHCLNGYFLFLFCRLLFINFNLKPQKAEIAALIAVSFWLLHPFFVSTVLYVVQRMAMLSALFSIMGLWLYSKGRLDLINDNRKGYITMTLALVLGTLFAVLSKENGILLPFLAASVELCIFKHPHSKVKPLNCYWAWIFLIVPSFLVVIYLIHDIQPYTFTQPFGNRNFNLPERLLTESRIVTGYLYHLIIPRLSYPGVLNENIIISKSIWDPPQTALCVLFLLALIIGAFGYRKRFPFIALSVLFFFAGHLLESTTIGLELYFEHRNYLPGMLLFLPVGYFFVSQLHRLIKGLIIVFLAVFPIFTHQLSTLWGNQLALTLFWAQQNPNSSRAQRTAALTLDDSGKSFAALQLLTKAKMIIPDSLDLHWHWMILKCRLEGVSLNEFNEIKQFSRTLPYNPYHFNMLKATIEAMLNRECKGLNSTQALDLLDVLITNPGILKNPSLLFQPHHFKGLVFASTDKPKSALDEYTIVLNLTQNVEHGLVQIGTLATHGYYKEALKHLYDVEKLQAKQTNSNTNLIGTKLDFPAEIDRIKKDLHDDIKNSQM